MTYKWKVVPLCKEQLLDIKSEDVLSGGVFRTCDVYKSGGGYDKFPDIYKKRTGKTTNPKQFVVQLYGCNLECPYCCVTQNGIWGDYLEYDSDELVEEFLKTGLEVFHLMGGAPALYIEHWPEMINKLNKKGNFVFHSDILLTEKRFDRYLLHAISKPNCLYAVNVKGVTAEDYKRNTNKEFDSSLFWLNLWDLYIENVPFYITFTNPDMDYYEDFVNYVKNRFNDAILDDSFVIELKEYDTVKEFNKNREN